MAQMNIDLDKIGKLTESDLEDKKTLKRLAQYVYQLTEQLKYWQYNLEPENFTGETQLLMQRVDALARQMKVDEESGEVIIDTSTAIEGADVSMTGTNSATVTGGQSVTVQSGSQMNVQSANGMNLSAEQLILTGYQLLRLIASQVLRIEGTSAESFIRLAYSQTGPAFMANGSGNLTARTGDFEELYVGGQTIKTLMDAYKDRQIEISAEQPNRTNVLWFKPSRAINPVTKTIYYTGYSIDGSMINLEHNTRTVLLRTSDRALNCDEVDYGFGMRIYNLGDSVDRMTSITVTVTGTIPGGSTQSYTIINEDHTSAPVRINAGGYLSWNVETEILSDALNITGSQSITVGVSVHFTADGNRSLTAASVQLKATGLEGEWGPDGEPLECKVYYIPTPTEE